LFALERNAAFIELEAGKFEEYLSHEGMTAALEERTRAGESDQSGRETYTRYLKAHVRVGDARDDVHARIVGHALELVLLDDPVSGDELRIRALLDGSPLAGAQIGVYVENKGIAQHSALTAADGTVAFPRRAGTWLVRTVHMQRCKGCERADWQSRWAAYSFAVPASVSRAKRSAPAAPVPRSTPRGGCASCTTTGDPGARWAIPASLVLAWALRRRFKAPGC
jgi:MYXO-CTERM domain-containing protein